MGRHAVPFQFGDAALPSHRSIESVSAALPGHPGRPREHPPGVATECLGGGSAAYSAVHATGVVFLAAPKPTDGGSRLVSPKDPGWLITRLSIDRPIHLIRQSSLEQPRSGGSNCPQDTGAGGGGR